MQTSQQTQQPPIKFLPDALAAKRVLGKHLPQERITVIELDLRNDGPEIQSYLGEITGVALAYKYNESTCL